MTWANFTREEFACQCGCGTNDIKDDIINLAQELRDACGFPLAVTSGYRCAKHPIEARKASVGSHGKGLAADFGVTGREAKILLREALKRSAGGVGVNQKGDHSGRFIHIDVGRSRSGLLWTY